MVDKMDKRIELAIKAVNNYKGDHLARATHAFKFLNKEQMQEQHGQSGRTRQEIMDGYIEHEQECNECIRLLTSTELLEFIHNL